jgi:membrane-bound ClpP family serine protease
VITSDSHDARDRKPAVPQAFRSPVRDEGAESPVSQWSQLAVGGLLLIAAVLSLVISPVSWPLLLIYAGIGVVVGLLEVVSRPTAVVGVLILIFGVQSAANRLSRVAPQWHAAWWQPVLIAVATSVLVYLTSQAVRRTR